MKIWSIDTTILSVPTPKPIALEYPEPRLVVASITTDDGPSGLGYSLVLGAAGAEAIQVYLETRLEGLLIGEDLHLVVAAALGRVDPRVNRRRVEAVRNALPDGVRLMIDVNQRLDVLANIQQARLLEDLDLVWYEEPVTADDLAISDRPGHGLAFVSGAEQKYRFKP